MKTFTKYKRSYKDSFELHYGGTTYLMRRIYAATAIHQFKVSVGDFGGYVCSHGNLSEAITVRKTAKPADKGSNESYDMCWITEKVLVFGNAHITGDCLIDGEIIVCDNASISGSVIITGKGKICGNAKIYGEGILHLEDQEIGGNMIVGVGPDMK